MAANRHTHASRNAVTLVWGEPDTLVWGSPQQGFRDQGVVLPEVESLRVQSLWLLKKALPSREEPDIYQYQFINF